MVRQGTQDETFAQGEADAWFSRNVAALRDKVATGAPEDPVLKTLATLLPGHRPRRVLEIGASNGWRLEILKKNFGCDVLGIELSARAVQDGIARGLEMRVGGAASLPLGEGEVFDLVIVSFVFHWIDRSNLFAVVREADRALQHNGVLAIADFMPDRPSRRRYHHMPSADVFTYKQDYARVFLASACYDHVGRQLFHHELQGSALEAGTDDRIVCDLVRKRGASLYVEQS